MSAPPRDDTRTLIGRERELEAISGVLERASTGTSGVVVLRGEGGIGKTALLDEAARRGEGFRVLRAAAFESEAEFPYATLHQLLQPLSGWFGALPDPQARALTTAFGLASGQEVNRLLVGLAVLTCLSAASEEEPVLCLIDDLQWMDHESLEALAFAARRLIDERVAMIWTVRNATAPLPPLPHVEELVVARLGHGDAVRLLAARHGDGLGSEWGTVIELAGGNPLALVELAGAAANGVAGLTTVEQRYGALIAELPAATRTLLLIAAAGEPADVATLAAAAQALGAELASLEPAERAGLVRVERDVATFNHPLMRAVAYRSATFGERRRVHAALATVLVGDDQADRRAWHQASAAIGAHEDVARLLEETAGRAAGRSGYGAAATALERAATLSENGSGRTRRLVRAAGYACHAGQRHRALALLEEAGGPAEDVRVQIEAARVRGIAQAQEGSLAEASRTFLDGARVAYPIDRQEALDLVTRAQEVAGLGGALGAVFELAEWAARLGDGETTAEEIMLGLVRGFAAIAAGNRAGARPALRRAADLGSSVDEPRLLVWSATAAMFLGDEPRLLDLLRRAVAASRSRGDIDVLPFALHLLAGAERRLGDIAGAEADATESRALALETGQPVVAAGALSTLTALAAFRGETARADELAAQTRALAQPRGLVVALAGVARARAELDLARGRAADALAELEAAVGGPNEEARDRPYALYSAPLLVEAAARAGVPDRVGSTLVAFEQWLNAGELGWAAPLAARGRALLADDDATAEEWYARALDLHVRNPQPYERARTQLLYGEFLRRARRKTEARAQLRDAMTTFESLGAQLWSERALAELRATGATARKRNDATRGELTPQELQIVRLVALGKTNPEVAAQLFLSPKTVQYHLRKVFAKLGIVSRYELTRLAAQGDVPGALAVGVGGAATDDAASFARRAAY